AVRAAQKTGSALKAGTGGSERGHFLLTLRARPWHQGCSRFFRKKGGKFNGKEESAVRCPTLGWRAVRRGHRPDRTVRRGPGGGPAAPGGTGPAGAAGSRDRKPPPFRTRRS